MSIRRSTPNQGYLSRFEVDSFTDGSKTYIVAENQHGVWECSCPVWKFRRKACKHVQSVQNFIATQMPHGHALYRAGNLPKSTPVKTRTRPKRTPHLPTAVRTEPIEIGKALGELFGVSKRE